MNFKNSNFQVSFGFTMGFAVSCQILLRTSITVSFWLLGSRGWQEWKLLDRAYGELEIQYLQNTEMWANFAALLDIQDSKSFHLQRSFISLATDSVPRLRLATLRDPCYIGSRFAIRFVLAMWTTSHDSLIPPVECINVLQRSAIQTDFDNLHYITFRDLSLVMCFRNSVPGCIIPHPDPDLNSA